MKPIYKILGPLFFLGMPYIANTQTFLHPTVGIQSEFVGSCLVSTCAGTYRDNGNNSNYANNINAIYRVFCPNAAGQCLRVTFNSFDVENQSCSFFGCTIFDFLTVGNGPTQNSTEFTSGPANASGQIFGTPATPFSYTSSDPSGCLTFRFTSDGSVTRSGWSATLSCVPCAAGPNGTDNNDCINATPVCSNVGISNNATGPGIVAEGCPGNTCPAGGENHTNWYFLEIQTSGTLQWNINPTDITDDYDFAMYGPNVSCGSLGNPVRCSDSGLTGSTGANAINFDNTENVNGNSFVAQMNVVAGQTYYMVVDEWSPNAGSGYSLNWGGTASLDCTVLLPVKLTDFFGSYDAKDKEVNLSWVTDKEFQNRKFILERSYDGLYYEIIGEQNSQGNSNSRQYYNAVDENPTLNGFNYYRLQWLNMDGTTDYSEVMTVAVNDNLKDGFLIRPNPVLDILEISFDDPPMQGGEIMIYNAFGQLLKTIPLQQAVSRKMQVDLSGLDNGLYILNIRLGNKSYQRKVVKGA